MNRDDTLEVAVAVLIGAVAAAWAGASTEIILWFKAVFLG